MSSHPPPVPPANRSDKGPGSAAAPQATGPKGNEGTTPSKTGQSANVKINTTHQGHQQDR